MSNMSNFSVQYNNPLSRQSTLKKIRRKINSITLNNSEFQSVNSSFQDLDQDQFHSFSDLDEQQKDKETQNQNQNEDKITSNDSFYSIEQDQEDEEKKDNSDLFDQQKQNISPGRKQKQQENQLQTNKINNSSMKNSSVQGSTQIQIQMQDFNKQQEKNDIQNYQEQQKVQQQNEGQYNQKNGLNKQNNNEINFNTPQKENQNLKQINMQDMEKSKNFSQLQDSNDIGLSNSIMTETEETKQQITNSLLQNYKEQQLTIKNIKEIPQQEQQFQIYSYLNAKKSNHLEESYKLSYIYQVNRFQNSGKSKNENRLLNYKNNLTKLLKKDVKKDKSWTLNFTAILHQEFHHNRQQSLTIIIFFYIFLILYRIYTYLVIIYLILQKGQQLIPLILLFLLPRIFYFSVMGKCIFLYSDETQSVQIVTKIFNSLFENKKYEEIELFAMSETYLKSSKLKRKRTYYTSRICFIFTPVEICYCAIPSKCNPKKRINGHYLANFIFMGIESVFYYPFIATAMIDQNYIFQVDQKTFIWTFNLLTATFFLSVLVILIYWSISIYIIYKGNMYIKKKGKTHLYDFYKVAY